MTPNCSLIVFLVSLCSNLVACLVTLLTSCHSWKAVLCNGDLKVFGRSRGPRALVTPYEPLAWKIGMTNSEKHFFCRKLRQVSSNSSERSTPMTQSPTLTLSTQVGTENSLQLINHRGSLAYPIKFPVMVYVYNNHKGWHFYYLADLFSSKDKLRIWYNWIHN